MGNLRHGSSRRANPNSSTTSRNRLNNRERPSQNTSQTSSIHDLKVKSSTASSQNSQHKSNVAAPPSPTIAPNVPRKPYPVESDDKLTPLQRYFASRTEPNDATEIFTSIEPYAEGPTGELRKARHALVGGPVAIKMVRDDPNIYEQKALELDMLRLNEQENLLQCFGSWISSNMLWVTCMSMRPGMSLTI